LTVIQEDSVEFIKTNTSRPYNGLISGMADNSFTDEEVDVDEQRGRKVRF